MEEIGVELWLVVERLAKKSPSSLVKEFCYRTNEHPPHPLPAASAPTAAKTALKATAAYRSVTERYAEAVTTFGAGYNLKTVRNNLANAPELRGGLRTADSATEQSVLSLVKGPAERALAAASPRLATDELRFPAVWAALGQCLVGCSLSPEELAAEIERIVVRPNVVPARWWTDDERGQSAVYALTRVGMVKDPPTMELHYEVKASSSVLVKGRRVIHLEEDIHSSTQPAALALVGRRLAQSHGFLFRGASSASAASSPQRKDSMENSILRKTSADAEILKWLTKLHQLVKFGRVSTPSKHGSGILSGIHGGGSNPLGGVGGFGGGGTASGGASGSSSLANTATFTRPPFPTAAERERQQQQKAAEEDEGPQEADIGLLYRDPEAAMRNVDLNKADDYTVKEFKAKMTEGFESNVVKPGDPGYKYDVRVETKTTGASEWDSD